MRVLLYLGCVVMAVWLMPRKAANNYQYELGKPWAYPLLTAPADMPVYPDSLSATLARDSIDATFRPVYKRDISMENKLLPHCHQDKHPRLGKPYAPATQQANKQFAHLA